MNLKRFIAILAALDQLQQVFAKEAQNCKVAAFDLLASAQEVALLIAAFTVGWHLIGPCLGFLRRGKLVRNREVQDRGEEPNAAKEPSQICKAGDLVESWLRAADQASFEDKDLPKPQLYTKALQACLMSNDLDSASQLLRRSSWQLPEGGRTAIQLVALARRFLKQRDISSAHKCIQSARRHIKVDLRTRRLFIVACAQSSSMDFSSKCFEELKREGLHPDFAMYSAMIRGFCHVGKVEDALTYFELMLRDRLQPDAMLFDALLEGCVSHNLLHGAEQVLASMKDLGVQPSNTTLAACIKLYSARGEIGRAYAVFDDMVQSHQLQPNAYVYGTLIAAALRNGRPELALATHDSGGCSPSARTYEHLMQCCLQLGLLERALEFLDEALGLKESAPSRRAFIDPKIVEELLVLIARRKESERLGMPLLKRLEAADFELPETFHRFVKISESQFPLGSKRRADLDRWRSFSR